jgi:hypothetical protein
MIPLIIFYIIVIVTDPIPCRGAELGAPKGLRRPDLGRPS